VRPASAKSKERVHPFWNAANVDDDELIINANNDNDDVQNGYRLYYA
jgi:hypothetical protein